MGLISRVSSRTYRKFSPRDINMPSRRKTTKKVNRRKSTKENITVKNEMLEFCPEKDIFQKGLIINEKKKPTFDKSFIQSADTSLNTLMSRCTGFLEQVPKSSSNSTSSYQSSETIQSPPEKMSTDTYKPTSFLEIESAWKKATTELQNDQSNSEDDLQFDMALCPLESIPEVLLPNFSPQQISSDSLIK